MAGNGSAYGFNATQFRDAIAFAMGMGAPSDPAQRITFRWRPADTYSIEDPTHRPYDFTDTAATHTAVADMQVNAALEFASTQAEASNPVGQFDETKVKVTLLDVDYNRLIAHAGRMADVILAGTNTYDVRFVAPPIGLFDVTVWQVYAQARDET